MKKTLIATTLLLSVTGVTQAQTASSNSGNPNDGTGYIGATALYSSKYLGSDKEDLRALPYLSLNNVKGFDLIGPNLTYRLIEVGTGEGLDKWSLRAGPLMTIQGDRKSEDSPTLNGFEDVKTSVPLGGYVRSTIGPIGLGFNMAQDIAGGHKGLTADASIGTFFRKGNFAIQPSASINWANNKHNDSFFSVSPAQSLASGLSRFDAGSGIYGYSAGFVSWVEFEDQYALSLITSYRWFTNDAADSPILNAPDGSKRGLFIALGLSRKFDTKQW